MNKEETFLMTAIKQMFKEAGHEFREEIIKKDGWYSRLTWNNKQEGKFKNWFIENIGKKLHIGKKMAENEFAYFNLMYGFKKEEDVVCLKCAKKKGKKKCK